jgi:hypothetical protein
MILQSTFLFLLLVPSLAECQASVKEKWNPATYRGIVVGKTKASKAMKILGPPDWRTRPEEGVDLLIYHRATPFDSRMEMRVENGIVSEILLHPENFSREKLITLYGERFASTRFGYKQCGGQGESVFVKSKDGPTEVIEYPNRGMYAEFVAGRLTGIIYSSRPFASLIVTCQNGRIASPK